MREVYQNEEEANVVDDTLEAMVREGSEKDARSGTRRGGERVPGQGPL